MQWSSEGLGAERELGEGERVFFWGCSDTGWWGRDGKTSACPGLFPSCFHPPLPPAHPPTHLHLWTSVMTRLVCKDSAGGWVKAASRHRPAIVDICCRHRKDIGLKPWTKFLAASVQHCWWLVADLRAFIHREGHANTAALDVCTLRFVRLNS